MMASVLSFALLVSGAVATPAGFDTLNFVGAELLGRPTDHSVTINVVPRTELEVRFEYGTDTTYGSLTLAETTVASVPHEVVIGGLLADTRYFYRMRYRVLATGDSLVGPRRTFHTQRTWGEPFTFAVEADPHMVPGEGDTADAFELTLQNIAASNPDLLIDLGDNFMLDKWAVATEDTIRMRMYQYRRWWDAVCHSIPLYIVLGNHEGEQGWDLDSTPLSRPVLFTNARKLYYPNPFPDGFYTGDSIPEQFVDLREDYYAWEWGNVLFVVLDPFWHTMTKPRSGDDNWYWTLGRDQFDWFRHTLEQSAARFRFVFIHHLLGGKIDATARGGIEYCHFYENGGYGTDSTWQFDVRRPGWGEPFHQVMLDNDVDILWHGHDHFYAKQDTDNMVYQMVPEPGRKKWDSLPGQAAEYGYLSGVLLGNRGYVRVTMDDTSATVAYIRTFLPGETTQTRRNGMVAHSYTIVKRDTVGAEERPPTGSQYSLDLAGSNPFRTASTIRYSLPAPADVRLKVYSAAGIPVRALLCGPRPAGRHEVIWDGTDQRGRKLAAGVYIVRLDAGTHTATQKLVLQE